MLADQHDTARLTATALGRTRHTRLLARTGSDAAALAEVRNAINGQLHHEPLSLPDIAQLAACRDRLADRNSNIPPELPAVWVQLGQPKRAEALARSITDPDGQARALANVCSGCSRPGPVRAGGGQPRRRSYRRGTTGAGGADPGQPAG